MDNQFQEAIKRHPHEAKSHFEIVDPGAWRFDVEGRLSDLGEEWIGPYCFCIDDVGFEAYGLKSRLYESQKMFLSDVGISVVSQRGLTALWPWAIFCGVLVLIIIFVYVVCNSNQTEDSGRPIQSVDAVDELFARAENRRLAAHAVHKSATTKDIPTLNNQKMSIKESARRAFRASKWDEAIKLVDQLSDESEADAELRYYIGYCYKEGLGIEHNYDEAFYWLNSAAEMGNAAAQYETGVAYENGNGVESDYGVALKWYKTAALRGNAMGCLSVGLMYDEGKGVAENPAEAALWYKKASDFGNAHAGYLLGNLYEEGRGVGQDPSMAAMLYRKSGSSGHAQAGYLLGKMYEEGRGVQQSNSEALYWYKKSGELGNAAALSAWQRLNGSNKVWLHPKK